MQHVCQGTSIMYGVTLCTMGTERLNTYSLQLISSTVLLDQVKEYFVSVQQENSIDVWFIWIIPI